MAHAGAKRVAFCRGEFDGADVELYKRSYFPARRRVGVGSVSKARTGVDSILVYTDDVAKRGAQRQRAPSRLELIHMILPTTTRWIAGAQGTHFSLRSMADKRGPARVGQYGDDFPPSTFAAKREAWLSASAHKSCELWMEALTGRRWSWKTHATFWNVQFLTMTTVGQSAAAAQLLRPTMPA